MKNPMPGPLEDLIRSQIAENGPMDVGSFMALALGHPQHGYYMTRAPFGRQGDFTTAPEISQMFGELIGAWAADIWAQLGRPEKFTLLECGPGRGTLMADALRATRRLPGFHQAARIVLMETSLSLRDQQVQALADYDVLWADNLSDPAMAGDGPVICIANEFLDALPVRQFVKQGLLWHERVVGVVDDVLAFGLSPPAEPPSDGTQDGIYEIAPARNNFVRELAALLRNRGGVALFIDYGYERSAMGDTLQAVRAHQPVPVLEEPGMADLTAHVDFQALAQAAGDLPVAGPVGQGAFLQALGIGIRAEMLKTHGADAATIDAAVTRLTDPAQMGTLFKVMALRANEKIKPAGF
jgi:NADH dehydrogenase [ubiquinone] 1 alpha subcomplex assembly factor 7